MVKGASHPFLLEFLDTDYLGVLKAVRDKIHLGHELLTHPLSGSVKPGETPYKTVILSVEKNGLKEESLRIIENSIQTCQKLTANGKAKNWSGRALADFQLIDYHLIFSD
jgi:hypothetical protein